MITLWYTILYVPAAALYVRRLFSIRGGGNRGLSPSTIRNHDHGKYIPGRVADPDPVGSECFSKVSGSGSGHPAGIKIIFFCYG